MSARVVRAVHARFFGSPWRAGRRLAALASLALAACACIAGCRDAGGNAAVPDPDLSEVEPMVREVITEARDDLLDDVQSADRWGELAMRLHAHGFDRDALQCYERAEALDPREARWPYLAGLVAMDRDPRDSIPRLERAATLADDDPMVQQTFGDALLRAGRADAARARYERALELDDASRRAHLGLGELALRERRLDDAARHLERALELQFADREVHAKLARLHDLRGDADAARREALLVRAYPDLAAVEDAARSEITRRTVTSGAIVDRGLKLIDRGSYEAAERAFRHAADAQPDVAKYRMNVANALALQGRATEAEDAYTAALALDDADPDIHASYAQLLGDLGRGDDARAHLARALELDPGHATALFNQAVLDEAAGRTAEAEAGYRRVLEADPVHAAAHNNLAMLLARRGRGAEAVDHWRQAVAFDQGSVDARFNLAIAEAQRRRFGPAAALLEAALERDPRHVPSLAALVTIRATCPEPAFRDGAEAVALAERLVAANGPSHVPSLELMAAALAEAGRFTDAIDTGRRALAIAERTGPPSLVALLRDRLARYEVGRPYHQP